VSKTLIGLGVPAAAVEQEKIASGKSLKSAAYMAERDDWPKSTSLAPNIRPPVPFRERETHVCTPLDRFRGKDCGRTNSLADDAVWFEPLSA
jgi:hypothetical protein